ncbi:hypothetical protein C8Q78DRAFT_983345 [Trametes maxima]|nr:hypothetical protein C8Q78DRAFT_983345 [Trametes maxima]
MSAAQTVLNMPELLSMIGEARCPSWQHYNYGGVLYNSDLSEVLALRTVSRNFYHHFVPHLSRTAISLATAYQLACLFSDVIAFEEKCCRCSLSGGHANRRHVNFLNIYLLEVDIHHENHNDARVWQLAQRAGRYMTGWSELNIVIDCDTSTTVLERIGHWWLPDQCPLTTLRLKDICAYGTGNENVSNLIGPVPWDNDTRFLFVLSPFIRLQTLLIDTPTFAYSIPLNIDLESFASAEEFAVFLSTYDFSPHEKYSYTQIASILPNLRRYYLQYLHWPPLNLTWEDPQGGTGLGRMFHVFHAAGQPIFGTNNLDHYDGQTHDLDPFSDWVRPYVPDPNFSDSPPAYEEPICIYCRIAGPCERVSCLLSAAQRLANSSAQ